jgi:hypothetical protein
MTHIILFSAPFSADSHPYRITFRLLPYFLMDKSAFCHKISINQIHPSLCRFSSTIEKDAAIRFFRLQAVLERICFWRTGGRTAAQEQTLLFSPPLIVGIDEKSALWKQASYA